MTRATFFKHFDLLADQPDAVAKIRELVLQLAVRGKLVEQDSKDEPAQNLVEKAYRAWPQLKARDRAKTQKPEPQHSLPQGWVWTCLDEIGDTNPRNQADDKLEVGFVPMKLISAKYGEPASFGVQKWGEIKRGFTHFADGDAVVAKITPCFENGKSAVLRKLKNGIGAGTTELHVFRHYSGCVVPGYVLIFLKSPRFILEGVPRMTGSAGQQRVPWDYFANTPFPLPPFAAQRRIVLSFIRRSSNRH
jgi:type I restriction enzyme, S subunit